MSRAYSRWVALRPGSRATVFIVLVVLVGNGFYVGGLTDSSPLSWTTNLVTVTCHLSCTRSSIDPNIGFITQPLGYLASHQVFSGHWPFWNPFEGLGQPLLGEMQAGALFPPIWLLALPAGLLWFHISLEIVAGLATYALVRRLGVDSTAATCAGCLFALNGTFAWLGNAVINPVCLLPVTLLAIEYVMDGVRWSRPTRWPLLAVTLALSMAAGFPEVAYLNLVLVAGWTLVRLWSASGPERLRSLGVLGLAGVTGLALAAPVLIPFADFMKVANIGRHAHGQLSGGRFSHEAATMFLDPYFFGTLFSNADVTYLWGGIGGYLTASVASLALVGAFSVVNRPLKRYLVAFVVVALLGMFNLAGARAWWNLLPFVGATSLTRYAMTAVEFAVILLAAFGLDRLVRDPRGPRALNRSVIVVTLALLWLTWTSRHLNAGVVLSSKGRIALALLHALPWVVLAFMIVVRHVATGDRLRFLVGGLLVLESLACFAVPTFGSPKTHVFDKAPVIYLQQHQGAYRFLDFTVLNPNWGSQFGLRELSAIDLPFPASFTKYIRRHLNPGLNPGNQFLPHDLAGIIEQEHLVARYIDAYEEAGVKHLLIPANVALTTDLKAKGVTLVFRDAKATIYTLPHPKPLFSAPHCRTTTLTDYQANVTCDQSSTLTYRELTMKGWSANVTSSTGATTSAPISVTGEVFQSINLPAGTSHVTFRFTPPHWHLALVLGVIALLTVLSAAGVTLRRERQRS